MKILSINYSMSLIRRTASNKLIKPKHLSGFEVSEKPVTANLESYKLKSYYKDALEKLNDIYLEKSKEKESTYIVENNIDAFKELPLDVQKAIDPADVTIDGHIDQETVNKLFAAAKNAGKPGTYGSVPRFKGRMEDISDFDSGVSDVMKDEISTGISENSDFLAENVSEHIGDITTETLHEAIGEEVINTVAEVGSETATESVIDHIMGSLLS